MNSLLDAAENQDQSEDKIKRPLNAFLLYCNDMRPILQAQNPGLSSSELAKMLGESWAALPSDSKGRYNERSNQLKTEFMATHPDYIFSHKSKRSPSGSPNPPNLEGEGEKVKRPTNAFLLFNKEKRPVLQKENPDLNAQDLSRKLGELWKSLDQNERKHYEQEAQSIREEFKRQNPDYVFTRSIKRALEKDPAENEEEKKRGKKKRGPAHVKHPMSPFFFFLKDFREKVSQGEHKKSAHEISQEASQQWNLLEEEKKDYFCKLSEQDKLRYAREKSLQVDSSSPSESSSPLAEKPSGH